MTVQPTTTMKTLLEDNWIESNTDGKHPKIANAEDDKDTNNQAEMNLARDDFVKIYQVGPETRSPDGVGAQGTDRDATLAIDIMIGSTKDHAYKVKTEVLRIIENNINSPGDDFQYTDPNISIEPFSGLRLRKMWRWVLTVRMVQTSATLGG